MLTFSFLDFGIFEKKELSYDKRVLTGVFISYKPLSNEFRNMFIK